MAATTGRVRAEQDRAVRRRAAILDAAVRVMARSGMGALSHRQAAAEAGVPLGAIRYYFDTREALLLACVEALDAARSTAAEDAIEAAAEVADHPAEELGRLLLLAYYGPDLDDAALRGTIGWVTDCARESPALSDRLAQLRDGVDDELRRLLDAAGHSRVPARLAGMVIDGAVFTATVEARPGIADHAIAAFCELVECIGEHR